jgi:hypothetical protein
MKIYENGTYREMTPEEIVAMEAQSAEQERQYWTTIDYDNAVNAEIRKRYSIS